ncbi:helix-turn-helix domain-containing protein, partial [Pseudomonas aeruginosa]|nr:helix-turn-helix domain-containing protein [Pseudomonas aeruginosa]HCL3348076.1 helix-turn-helix domain-containing protein [Pseudomonas aeruginosa]HCL3647299.1 helix-turn-helix domain-containing protein [Pseudomonas aeruginosa]
RLLLFTGGSVNEICYQLGFKDPAYFSRFFVRYAGLTPSAYRQRQADGESRR